MARAPGSEAGDAAAGLSSVFEPLSLFLDDFFFRVSLSLSFSLSFLPCFFLSFYVFDFG